MTQDYNLFIAIVSIVIGALIAYFVSKESKRSLDILEKKKIDFELSEKDIQKANKKHKSPIHA